MDSIGINHLRFIHASDLHLGCQQFRNEMRSYDYLNTLKEILILSKKHAVNFILLSGDIFTSIDILPGYFQQIIETLDNFKRETEIPIIAIEGNHDIRRYSHGSKFERGQSWLKILSYLDLIILLDFQSNDSESIIFQSYDQISKKGGKIQIKFAEIYGTRFLREKIEERIPQIEKTIPNNDKFHILMQHFGIEGQMEDVPGINLKSIQCLKKKVHYLALGHYHLQYSIDGWIFNPGAPEPASLVEFSYKRGIFLVDVIKKEDYIIHVKSIKLRNRSLLWRSIKIPYRFDNYNDLSNFIIEKLENNLNIHNFNKDPANLSTPILCLRLNGKSPFKNQNFNNKTLTKLLRGNLPVLDLRVYSNFDRNFKTLDEYQTILSSTIKVNTKSSQKN